MEFYELTNPQKSIWLTEQFYKNTSVNNIGGTVIVQEEVNFDLLKEAIYAYVKANDSFRLRLLFDEAGNIKQYVSDFTAFPIDCICLSSLEELTQFEKEDCEKTFSMLESPLFRFTMFRFPDGHGGIVLTVHHLIADALTASQTASQIIDFYSGFLYNQNPNIQPPSYIDYIHSESDYLLSEKYKKDKSFWEALFQKTGVAASLSTKSIDASHANDISSHRECFFIEKRKLDIINTYCKTHKISKFNFFMAIFSLYIGKVTNEKNFVIGTPILNRTNFKEKNTAGMFISTIPFPVSLENNVSFSDFANQISLQTLSIFRHQKYPYPSILEYVRKQDPSVPNLYNMMISYQINKSEGNQSIVPYTTRWTHSDTNTDELDIHLFDINDTGELSIAYDYQVAKYTQEDITLLHRRILFMIDQVIDHPSILTSQVSLVLPEERDYLLRNYNRELSIPVSKTIVELFEDQVLRTPNQIAVSHQEYHFSYAELNNAVNYLTSYLRMNGVKPKDKVCLFFHNSIDLVLSILAILKLGACYIPIDVTYPMDRIEYIVHNSKCKKILTNAKQVDKLGILSTMALDVNLDWIRKASSNTIYLNNSKNRPSLEDLAYIIYTSGSTGKPKGVKIAHESLANYISWAKKVYVREEVTNFPLYSSISFDLTVTSIFTPLISGNGIYIYENANPQLLLKNMIEDKKVQIIKLTPAHLTLLQDTITKDSCITKLIVGGDILTNEMCSKITNAFSHPIHIFNEYGPTEATVGCMIHEYSPEEKGYASVPIGVPADNTNLFVLNDDLNLVPFGYNGQLYIAGKGLAKGYVHLPTMTASKFIACPFLENQLMYQTGDIVKLYANGMMEYIGRSDFQVKINGYRIETGEIQSKILTYPNIKDCYVAALTVQGNKVLCVYYVCDKPVNLNNLKTYLQKTLPTYMIPKYYVNLNEIPLTGNGKVNKSLLTPPSSVDQTLLVAPENDLERALHHIFCELLQINVMSVIANFFDYYIDSLTIIKAQTKLYSMGYQVNTQDFYEYPSIRKLAAHLLQKDADATAASQKDIPVIPEIIKPNTRNRNFQNILLFGATGFLGVHLLHELLVHTNAKIYCIIREKDNLNAIQRFHNKFNFYFKEDESSNYEDRIITLTGNILKEHFGLSEDQYTLLGSRIDCVIDSAALVKHYGEYEEFNDTNVKGTQKVIDFCKKYHIPLHYISTLSVSGYGLVKSPETTFTENDFYIGQNYEDNVYVKSKFEAEKLILNTCKYEDLCANIYRIGNITNRFSDGVFQQNAGENAFLNRLTAFINLKCIPEELLHVPVEFTPVDYCAAFIIAILTQKEETQNLAIYHLYNQNYLDFHHLFQLLKESNISIAICSMSEFEKKVLEGKDAYFGIISYLANVKNDSFNGVSIDNTYTNSVLQQLSLSWPTITADYLQALLKYLIKNKFVGDEK